MLNRPNALSVPLFLLSFPCQAFRANCKLISRSIYVLNVSTQYRQQIDKIQTMLASLKTVSPILFLFGSYVGFVPVVVNGDENLPAEKAPPAPAVLGQACRPDNKGMGGRDCDNPAGDLKCVQFNHEQGKEPHDTCVKRIPADAGLGFRCFDAGNDIKPGFWKTVLMEGSAETDEHPNVVVGYGLCPVGHWVSRLKELFNFCGVPSVNESTSLTLFLLNPHRFLLYCSARTSRTIR